MDCERAVNLINARVDGECDAGDGFALDAHLAECAACRGLLDETELQDAALLRAFAPGRAAADGVAERVSTRMQVEPPRARRWIGWMSAVAALVVVATTLAVLWPKPPSPGTVALSPQPSAPPPPPPVAQLTLATGEVFTCPSGKKEWEPLSPGDSVAAGARIRTADAAKCEIELTDGSRIRMNTQTEACFAEPRNVQVTRGQLWSAVAQNAPPLHISAGHAAVTAKGHEGTTRVDLASAADAATVTVLSGAADVAGQGKPTTVTGGQTLRVSIKPNLFQCTPLLDAQQPIRWQDDLLTLKPGDDPELVARVKQLLAKVSVERAGAAAPGPVEQDIRSRGDAWSGAMACVARSPGVTPEERRTAASLLADLAPAWCIPDLIELLNDEDGQVRSHAAKALQRLTGHTMGASPAQLATLSDPATVAAWRDWWQRNEARHR